MPAGKSSGKYSLQDPVTTLPLVGQKYSDKLARLGIETIGDFIFHFPFRYEDTREIISIVELIVRGCGTIIGKVDNIGTTRTRSGKFLTTAYISDETGTVAAMWFNQPYLSKSIKQGETYIFNGKTNAKWGPAKLMSPQYELAGDETTHLARLTPVYPETYGASSKWLRARLKPLKAIIGDLVIDYLPNEVVREEKTLPLAEAIVKAHFPESETDISEAKERLGLDELIAIQKQAIEHARKTEHLRAVVIEQEKAQNSISTLLNSLNYKLTKAQEKALIEILKDLNSDKPMHRLLNGDVGSGKTIVALAAAVAAAANDRTSVIMAPTTILANQHYQTISKTLKNAKLDIQVQICTATQKAEFDSQPQIIIGTHAILYKRELPANTAFVVIDEQHRFGVGQREQLRIKSQDGDFSPHYLTMSATPIPRTLALAIYGQTSVSILDEMPEGRVPIKTYLVPNSKRIDSYEWIASQCKEGNQGFVICPLVNESEKVEAKSAKEEYARLVKVFKKLKLGLVHGQMPPKEKDATLSDFSDKKYDLLVATPVVEVGIDIPNATMMIIENAERFGLAQLHQFRGRIGRGTKPSHCFLFSNSQTPEAKSRLEFFSKNNSGFKVAEYDLKHRGPGEVYGLKQSGILQLRFADITNIKQIQRAQRIAKEIY